MPYRSTIGQRTRKRHEDDAIRRSRQTITMTTTFGSLSFGSRHSAAAMLRLASTDAMTRLVSPSEPRAANQSPKPNAINRSPARIPRVAEDFENLVDVSCGSTIPAGMRLILGNQVEHGLHPTSQVLVTQLRTSRRRAGAASAGRGSEHIPWINSNSREQQGQDIGR